MAITKINTDVIADNAITTDKIAAGALDTQLAGYLSTNSFATETFVGSAITTLIDAAPGALDTLNELAAALGDDPNFATTVTNSIATKLPLSGGIMTGTGSVKVPAGTTEQRDGVPINGMFRYNSTNEQFEGYQNSEWGSIGGGGGGSNTFTTDTFTGDGTTGAYALSQVISSENNLMVFIAGVFQQQSAYTLATALGVTTLTFSTAPANTREIIIYSIAGAVSGTNLNVDSMVGDGTTVVMTLSITPVNENNTQVFVDGVYQSKSNYSISGTTLTFSTAPPIGTDVEVITMNQTEINVPVDGTVTSAKLDTNIAIAGTLDVGGAVDINAGTIDGTVIGGTTPAAGSFTTGAFSGLTVEGAGFAGMNIQAGATSIAAIDFGDSADTNIGGINYNNADDTLNLRAGNLNRVTVTSAGNVGIGTTSPLVKLDVLGSPSAPATSGTAQTGSLRVSQTAGNGVLDMGFYTSATGTAWLQSTNKSNLATNYDLTLQPNGGNVGIGISSPSAGIPLTAYYSPTSQMHLGGAGNIVSNNTYFNGTAWVNRNSAIGGAVLQISTDGSFAFRRAGTGASPTLNYSALIDASGNLLVGKTTTAFNTVGIRLEGPNGKIEATRSNNVVMDLNRLNGDGTIANFSKDGTTVGSIGVSGGNNLYISGLAASHSGLTFATNQILPSAVGAITDGAESLGNSSSRFKDLYLSGGVYLGGTGATNHLDDYEEGTWTPTLGSETVTGSAASTNNNNKYVKIGRLVHVTGWFNSFSFSTITSGTYVMVRGLPFRPEHHSTSFKFSYTQASLAGGTYGYGHTSLYACYILVGGSTGAAAHLTRAMIGAPSTGTTHFMFDATYYTND